MPGTHYGNKKGKVAKMMGGGMMKKKTSSMGYAKGGLKSTEGKKGLSKLPKDVRNKMGYMNKGGLTKAETSAKGKKAAMMDEKKGKSKGKPAVIIAMNKGGLYANINARKKAGTSRSKAKSTISPKAYSNMKKGFPKK
tara:strand:+ start:2385 stop:2798 length:414 start_codon:yes stop_codon:yes gene_type:complete